MKRFLSLILLFIPIGVAARKGQALQPSAGIMIRALVLPYALGNANGMYYTGGAEYIFAARHGFGIDFAYNDYSAPDAPYPGSSETPPRLYSVSRGLVLSYRRYLRLHDCRALRYRPYLSSFMRYGNRSFHPESGYVPKDLSLENRLKYDEQQYSLGLMCGLITGYRFGRVNLDLGAGPFFKVKTAQDRRLEPSGIRTYHSVADNFGVRFALTVNYLWAFTPRS